MNDNPEERFMYYDKNHCWQYDMRLKTLEEDCTKFGLTKELISTLKVKDFTFNGYNTEGHPNTPKELVKKRKVEFYPIYKEIKEFIIRYEWLGTMPHYPTHFFTARYNGILAGVIIMDMPNTFTKLLGKETRLMERLISRGACISWSPKGLASSLLMWAIKWMVQNTRYRIFTAYSDPEALELGTIYQACSFYYLGQTSGANKKYQLPTGKWVSDRYFRSRSAYMRIVKELNIPWNKDWQKGSDNIDWKKVPDEYEKQIKNKAKEIMLSLKSREAMPKHKYCYVAGKTKKETKELLTKFVENNPKLFEIVHDKSRADANFQYKTPEGFYLKRLAYPQNRGK